MHVCVRVCVCVCAVNTDLKALNIQLNSWYNLMLECFQLCTREVMDSHHSGMRCTVEDFNLKCGCGRSFYRQGNLTRYLKFCDDQP